MTEIEIETYSSDSYSDEENYEYSYILITPDDSIHKESNEINKQESMIKTSSDKKRHHHKHNNSFSNENSSFSEFITRQNDANRRRLKIRDNPPTERRFNPPPFKFILESAVPPPKVESPNNKKQMLGQYSSLFQRSINRNSPSSNNNSPKRNDYSNLNSFAQESNDMSFRSMSKTIDNYVFDTDLISKNSELIADEKNSMLIINTCGSSNTLNQFRLEQILRRFNIKDKFLVAEVCSRTKAKSQQESNDPSNEMSKSIFGDRLSQSESNLYDNRVLKKLLIRSLIEDIDNLSSFEIKLRNCMSSSLRNDKYLSKKKKL